MTQTDPQQNPRDPASGASSGPKSPADRRSTLSALLHHTVTALIVAVLMGTGVWLYLRLGASAPSADTAASDTAASSMAPGPLEAAQRASERLRVERALGVARLIAGKSPENLKFLLREGLLVHRDLYYSSGDSKFAYRRTAEGFVLESHKISGHDGADEP